MGDTTEREGTGVLRGSTAFLVLAVLARPRLVGAVLRFAGTVVKRFFFDQFVYRARLNAGPGGRFRPAPPIRNIEHPLDAAIPVRYETVGLYLTFVRLWISALSYLRRRIGRSFDADIERFLVGLDRCYVDASGVYGRCLSTTRRPGRAPSPRLAFIYAVDPHLFCVPSLHVLVVCYTYRRLEELLRERGDAGRFAAEIAELRARAVAITESILYVRQHSVNCIPTALAMLSVIVPTYDRTEAKAFLAELFVGDEAVSDGDRRAALAYMDGLYDRVAGRASGERYDAIVDFLDSYEEMPLVAEGMGSAAITLSEA
ncbi:MAG: hypothetical protein KKA67_13780 [Spirochaetes bacterium]|nr:hypothetical protein [Spirochaetota bacterium]MBU1079734.1 hypothetical protein [Spirochaetota bacterium]